MVISDGKLSKRVKRLGASNFDSVDEAARRQADMLRRLEDAGLGMPSSAFVIVSRIIAGLFVARLAAGSTSAGAGSTTCWRRRSCFAASMALCGRFGCGEMHGGSPSAS